MIRSPTNDDGVIRLPGEEIDDEESDESDDEDAIEWENLVVEPLPDKATTAEIHQVMRPNQPLQAKPLQDQVHKRIFLLILIRK